MNPEAWAVVAVVAIIGTIAGMIIGYYKARGEFGEKLTETLKGYLSEDDCKRCDMRAEVKTLCTSLNKHTALLEKGQGSFESLRTDITLIKNNLGIKSPLEELKKMIAVLEKG